MVKHLLILLAAALISCSSAMADLPPLIGVIHADTPNVLFGNIINPILHQGHPHSDLLIWNGRSANYLYRGGINFDTLPFLQMRNTSNCDMSGVGDLNNDSFDDIAILGNAPYGWKYNAYFGGSIIDTTRDLWFGVDSVTPFGPAATCNNLTGNGANYLVLRGLRFGFSELMCFRIEALPDSTPSFVISSKGIVPIDSRQFGEDFAVGDFNGDGNSDIAAGFPMNPSGSRSGEVWVYFGGASFDTIPDLVLRYPAPFFDGQQTYGWVVESLGDLNGDGYDDFGVGSVSGDTSSFIYFGGAILDTMPAIRLSQNAEVMHSAGDFNGDGYPDVILCTPLPFSSGNRVRIYYGGPMMDGIPDQTIWDWMIPGFHTLFGSGCTGVGDFNGDGSQDIAFFLFDALHNGQVYIFSGQLPTDVPFGHDPALPAAFDLKTNYPNPFNGTTTIEFSVPQTMTVKLSIYNALGQQVATLLDRRVSPGTYRGSWSAQGMSSGVYFAVLEGDGSNQMKKMIYLK